MFHFPHVIERKNELGLVLFFRFSQRLLDRLAGLCLRPRDRDVGQFFILFFVSGFVGALAANRRLGPLVGLEKRNFGFLNQFTAILARAIVRKKQLHLLIGFGLFRRVENEVIRGAALQRVHQAGRKKLHEGFLLDGWIFLNGFVFEALLERLGLIHFLVL